MKKLISLIFAASTAPAFAACPPPKDLSAMIDPLMNEIAVAPNEMAARLISNQLWEHWATAPDQRAQEMLDSGLRMRAEFNLNGAWEAFDQLVAYCPDYAEGYNQRAFVAFIQKDYVSALDDLEKTLVRDPDHIGALAGKALTEIGLNGPDAGQATLREALKLSRWLTKRRFLIDDEGEDI